jgi:hypothetical protein
VYVSGKMLRCGTMDNQLLEIASNPVNTIPDVIAAFEAIDAALPDSDGLKWFNWLYLTVTKSVDANLATTAPSLTWNNPAWMAQLDVIFARLYLDALRLYLTPGMTPAGLPTMNMNTPKCWAVLFEARNDVRLARVQFAMAGINAHIDHDLSVAVVETCRQFGIKPVHGSPEYRDYTQVNTVLDPIVTQAKTQLLTGLLGDNLPSINLVEDLASRFGLKTSREAAWTNAEILRCAEMIPGLGDRFLSGLDSAAALAGQGLLAPVGV